MPPEEEDDEEVKRQVAVLLLFPPGVDEEKARRLLLQALELRMPREWMPAIQQLEEVEWTDHEPVIYLP